MAQQTLTPREIISRYIDRNTTKESGMVTVRGVYFKVDDAAATQRQRAFDKLKDELTDSWLKLLVPHELRDFIGNGETVEMTGTISDYGFRDSGSLQVQMNVTSCVQAKEIFIPKVENDRFRIRRQKAARGFKDVRKVLAAIVAAGDKPKVALVYPSSTVANTDFERAIGAAAGYYQFETRYVAFSDPLQFVSVLKDCGYGGRFDLVCIVRGGGAGLQNLDNVDVLAQVAEMDTPVLTAVGHAEDDLFIDTVADLSRETPSLLGTFLKEIVEERMRFNRIMSEQAERRRRLKKAVVVLSAALALAVCGIVLALVYGASVRPV